MIIDTSAAVHDHETSVTHSGDVPTSLRDALTRLPKVELHVHLEGTMLPDTLVELASKNGVTTAGPELDPAKVYRYDNLTEFLDVFWFVQSVVKTREDWTMLAWHSAARATADETTRRHLRGGFYGGDKLAGSHYDEFVKNAAR